MEIIFPADRKGATIQDLVSTSTSDVLFLGDAQFELNCPPSALERMADVLSSREVGMVYSDSISTPRIDYQEGSIRDDFDFGPLIAISTEAARRSLDEYGGIEHTLKWAGLYDLRLKVSIDNSIVRISEALYSARDSDTRTSGERHFDYVNNREPEYQGEMERTATSHLKRVGAYLKGSLMRVKESEAVFPLQATIVIPVRNRESTLGDAIVSAIQQEADFQFNVIIVDNHSTDRTGSIIKRFNDDRIIHLVPGRTDLGIGGCWNEAIYSDQCGQYAVQLDSDDLFSSPRVLAELVDKIATERFAMLIGSYSTVNFELQEIAPGVVDHREWTSANGPNNALRINGFGAPRVYDVEVLRKWGFPNVSYGEDYAVCLRTSRDYELGRIFDPVYLCRRWEGNSDNKPPVETVNRFNSYKDGVRTLEMRARKDLNRTR